MTDIKIPEGARVAYLHLRPSVGGSIYITKREWKERGAPIAPKGGMTQARVITSDGTELAEGVAVCRPDENFNRRLGRTIALGRALKALEGE